MSLPGVECLGSSFDILDVIYMTSYYDQCILKLDMGYRKDKEYSTLSNMKLLIKEEIAMPLILDDSFQEDFSDLDKRLLVFTLWHSCLFRCRSKRFLKTLEAVLDSYLLLCGVLFMYLWVLYFGIRSFLMISKNTWCEKLSNSLFGKNPLSIYLCFHFCTRSTLEDYRQ